ncbi:MAG: hypothetical protein M1832_000556 [Thelocarpon impressellum]|nr:MAG: hypothetical protein M1832_000556 [Thelocarpon impressellum]
MAASLFRSALPALLVAASIGHAALHKRDLDLPVAHAALQKRDLIVPTALPGEWTSSGCYTDGVGGQRTLSGAAYASNMGMSNVACINYCDERDYVYAGTEYSSECYCGNTLSAASGPAPAADCSMACSGNITEACGGPGRLNLFFSGGEPPAGPTTNPGPAGWTSEGCYSEGAGGRTLPNGVATTGGGGALTIALCTSACRAAGFNLAGAEYGGECFCGNTYQNGGAPAASGCDMTCNGNSSEFCGGPSRLNAYRFGGAPPTPTSTPIDPTATTTPTAAPTGPAIVPSIGAYNFLGCYTEATGTRALSAKVFNTPDMSLDKCAGLCAGYQYFGAEYGSECYCGDSLAAGSVRALNQADCSFTCPGNLNQFCGAGNRLELYQIDGTAPTPTPTATTTATTATGTGSATGLPAGWAYAGCYSEGSTGRAITAYQAPDNAALTIESCVQTCVGLGYPVAGMEFSSQCFCGRFISNGGALVPDTECSNTCSGNAAEKCGGPARLSIYSNGPLEVYQPPAAQTTGLPGSWEYQGCLQDNAGNGLVRTFIWQIIFPDTNDAETCLNQCAKFGYMAAGMEYGDECYCGDVAHIDEVGAALVPETECNVLCSGNPSFMCGGGSRLSYYKWTGTPLYVWDYPQGPAAGKYELLIGGVCVPLLTTVGVNGKVTFVEKYGTGTPNSTGAYELDLSLVDNFSQAWREMHVETDVFCSASITLPDKAGRQLNIGGWSGESLSGVRLYWPDGSPGTPSVRDWQENVDTLKLQRPRWYPSAMIMTNGSILVIGGQVGSNGAPEPTMELLPGGGPVLTLEYLRETDPFNLYPFLAVLPSGGIFIALWNRALIMDETTFATVRELEGIPGTVNNPLGGRTYPLEGTMVLLPQEAPYTEPLTVLICGGSTPGPAQAIDNCVSTQPEVPGAPWVIERMPSQRVLTCMTALPDGSFMIINGAHKGVAGFGLATDPNLNAVIYDPSQPVNQRMSVMQNTTVARLYHSEANLLPDGRVLVSGSDPQDGTNPEEYRVEVFTPPYLLSGLPRPSFEITNKDWTYGQSVSITVQIPVGGPGGVRVSLLGAESSTHGATMGQRSIFPAVTCGGGSCTITAPPNANVCPPGWYQVFVLDGPTPSTGTFVRIGGDPGEVGNWPNLPGFDTPGI